MNRIFLSFTLLTLLACNSLESTDLSANFDPDSPFSVSISTTPTTKGALVNRAADMGSIGIFCAYTALGYWSTTTEFSKFDNQRFIVATTGDCTIDGDEVGWGYTTLDDKYTICAYSPHSAYDDYTQGITPSINNGELVINYTVPHSSADQPDLMLAEPQKDITPQNISGSVPLTFYHTLASVGFNVVSSVDVKILSVDIKDVASEGSVSWGNGVPTWSISDSTGGEFTVDMVEYTPQTDSSIQINSEHGYLMMIPQTLEEGAEIVVTFDNYLQKSLIIPAGSVWLAGMTYLYTIKLDDSAIKGDFIFNSKQISNCYIVNPTKGEETIVQIPIEDRINDFWNNYSGEKNKAIDSETALAANRIWDDFSVDFTLSAEIVLDDEGKVAVRLIIPEGIEEGNLLFSITKSNVPMWSWHIWVTDYNPDAIAAANKNNIVVDATTDTSYSLSGYNGAVHRYIDNKSLPDTAQVWSGIYKDKFIMDRNIGERSSKEVDYSATYGDGSVYYQHGRKDPFPGNSGDDIGKRSSSGRSFVESVEFVKDFFFTANSSATNWCDESGTRDICLIWFDKNISVIDYSSGKSIFDPSPLGWRVPVSDTWRGFYSGSISSYGYYGYRDGLSSGTLNGAQKDSYVWSANPNGSWTAYCFSFADGEVISSYISNGLPIRAIQE